MTEISVPDLSAPVRLDRFLVDSESVQNRSRAKVLIDAGCIRVGGKIRKAGFLVRGGELLCIEVPPFMGRGVLPEEIPLALLYLDDHIAAIDKPAGLVVHPAPGSWTGTLVNALLHHGIVPADGERPGIVHRLDKETSGVMVVARTSLALEALGRAFHDRLVEKVYLALVVGCPSTEEGWIDRPIGRHPSDRKRMSVNAPKGRSAKTRWRVLERFPAPGVSLVEAIPESGRTHQIRVHLASLGHPVLADPVYGSRRGRAWPPGGREGVIGRLGRQALHAVRISFDHPITGEPFEVSTDLPPDLAEVLDFLRIAAR